MITIFRAFWEVDMDCPCKDCKERVRACHDVCDAYKVWKAWLTECREKEKSDRTMYVAFGGMNKR